MMLTFDKFFLIHIVAQDPASLPAWVIAFSRWAPDGFTVTDVEGGWQMADGSIVFEPCKTFQVFSPSAKALWHLLKQGASLQVQEAQEAIAVQYCTPETGWNAVVVFDTADWDELEALLTPLFE